MKVNLEFLKEHEACKQGIGRFKEFDVDELDILEAVKSSDSLKPEDVGFVFWCAAQALSHEKTTRYACDLALVNIEKIKPHCSDKDYDLITGFLNDPDGCVAARADDAAARAADAAYADWAADVRAAHAAAAAYYAVIDTTDITGRDRGLSADCAARRSFLACETPEEKAAVKEILIKALEEARNYEKFV